MKSAQIPMRTIGPIKIRMGKHEEAVKVPLATFETPLWPSVARGAKISMLCGGISVVIANDRMTRSIVLQALSAKDAVEVRKHLCARQEELDKAVQQTSRFVRLLNTHFQVVGNLLYIRFECSTGDASGHNMVTKAADQLCKWILAEYSALEYVSISSNFCVDKKVSAVNSILGRGKYVVAEINVSRDVCQKILKTTPEKIVDLNIKKNFIGSTLAGSLRSANAHFANMLLAFYLATGQDAANIVEGSQGITFAEVKNEQLYFSVTLPNVIVGTIGNGKDKDFVQENLKQLGCLEKRKLGDNARRLAQICAATVLCGELSLLAVQTNLGELMRTHEALERNHD